MYSSSPELRADRLARSRLKAAGGWRLGKPKASDRIDAIIALAMAVTGTMQRKGSGGADAHF